MSMPKLPEVNPELTSEQALNMILSSIAMEELALSNILNAEGEKLQYVLRMFETGCGRKPTIDEVLSVNQSITCLLDSVSQNQMVLKSKMDKAIFAMKKVYPGPCQPGPPGPPGQCGPKGEPGAPGKNGCCNSAAFPGRSDQCWTSGKPLRWAHTECPEYNSIFLSPDGKRIILERGGNYAVCFSLNLRVPCDKRCVSIGVQTLDANGRSDKFVYHGQIVNSNTLFTASAGGIFIPTGGCNSTELMLTLFSPDSIEVKQSSISVIEVCS